MKVLILGNGGREHALAWRMLQSSECKSLFVWPGNTGTGQLGRNINLNPGQLVDQIVDLSPDLVVIGPESFLAEGLVDKLAARGISVFGPTKAAAQIEISKSFALELMQEAHIPHPESHVFLNPEAVGRFAQKYKKPIVVKADGLAQGKGVRLCYSPKEADRAAHLWWELYGEQPLVVQELLEGKEISVFCFTDGDNISSLVAACDYKRVGEGDTGTMTGGMGSYAWPESWTEELEQEILRCIIRPMIRTMAQKGIPFAGMVYAGLMITKDGPKVLKFNARFGDPEAQVILPLLEGNLFDIMQACTEGCLHKVLVLWNHEYHTVGVVLASEGYPDRLIDGSIVGGLEMLHPEILVFQGGKLGRLMTLVAKARCVGDAVDTLYANIEGRLTLHDVLYRKDIGTQRKLA